MIFAYWWPDASSFGVVELNEADMLFPLKKNRKTRKSNLAITVSIFYDEKVVSLAANLKPSERGELEITDLNQIYLSQGELRVEQLPRGTRGLDVGNFSRNAGRVRNSFIRFEARQGLRLDVRKNWRGARALLILKCCSLARHLIQRIWELFAADRVPYTLIETFSSGIAERSARRRNSK